MRLCMVIEHIDAPNNVTSIHANILRSQVHPLSCSLIPCSKAALDVFSLNLNSFSDHIFHREILYFKNLLLQTCSLLEP